MLDLWNLLKKRYAMSARWIEHFSKCNPSSHDLASKRDGRLCGDSVKDCRRHGPRGWQIISVSVTTRTAGAWKLFFQPTFRQY